MAGGAENEAHHSGGKDSQLSGQLQQDCSVGHVAERGVCYDQENEREYEEKGHFCRLFWAPRSEAVTQKAKQSTK